MSRAAPAPAGIPPAQPLFGPRLATGLLGVLLAAMMAGLNNRVPALGLAEIRGALGWSQDQASWLGTAYAAGELVAMPFASWLAITFSMRRFLLTMLAGALLIALLCPWVQCLPLLIALRALQGLCCGTLIPLLMMAALRFLPPAIRLHGLALYAMTATFAPNVAIWLAAQWLDRLEDWRWLYWQALPLGLLAMGLIAWGIPRMPPALPRLRQANWWGMVLAVPGLSLLAVALDQGNRLDWLASPLIVAALGGGAVLSLLFVLAEWRHPAPFIKLQLLERRNLGLGFALFVGLLIAMSSGVALPSTALAHLQGFRAPELAPLGLLIGLPQLLLGPAVALLLYQRWVDARWVFVAGLLCIALACGLGARIGSDWMVAQLLLAELLQALGQPMAVVSLLFLATSVVQPMEGPFVAGIVNTLRALGTLLGGALVGQMSTQRGSFHAEMLLDHAGRALARLPLAPEPSMLGGWIGAQASVLALADVYRALGLLALLLVPLVLCLQRIPAPLIPRHPSSSPSHG